MALVLIVWGYVCIYRRKEYVGGAPRGPRGRGRAYPPRRALHPRGPLTAPPTYFFHLYILLYPETIGRATKPLFHRRNLLYRDIPS